MKNIQSEIKHKLASLWILVMFNMLFADVFSIVIELVQGEGLDIPIDVNIAMAIAVILTNIPIFMIYLSISLAYKANRIANISAGIFTIIYIIGGGSLTIHYIIIASIEIILLLIIIVNAYRWKEEVLT